MAANRTQPRTWPPDRTSKQMQIDDILYRRHCVRMLRHAHRPARDERTRVHDHLRRFIDLLSREAARTENVVPSCRVDRGDQIVVTLCLCGNKIVVENGARLRKFAFEQHLHQPLYHGHIAADADRKVKVGKRGRLAAEQRQRPGKRIAIMLRIRVYEAI